MKRKGTKTRDREPAERPESELPDPARLLREQYERGMAELAEWQKVDPTAR